MRLFPFCMWTVGSTYELCNVESNLVLSINSDYSCYAHSQACISFQVQKWLAIGKFFNDDFSTCMLVYAHLY